MKKRRYRLANPGDLFVSRFYQTGYTIDSRQHPYFDALPRSKALMFLGCKKRIVGTETFVRVDWLCENKKIYCLVKPGIFLRCFVKLTDENVESVTKPRKKKENW